MRALSVRQPWAALIAWGEKTVEVRSWSTRYRGPLLIHASGRAITLDDGTVLEAGEAVAVAQLIDVRPMVEADLEAACLDELPEGAFAWILADAREIEPIPLKGRLNLWEADVMPRLLAAG